MANKTDTQATPTPFMPPTSFRLTKTARLLLVKIATRHGLKSTPALEMIIRKEARDLGIPVVDDEGSETE